ncbi:MAG TPA: YhcH/YjgK/YiaL family protein [Candidatus Desulfovibrio gallistercoris]|nr:YhcH/YjgK/YiaL family protein [Candidatus Desulfovibrio gallistercoris]
MIVDTFERGARYLLGECWNSLYPELMELVRQGENLPDGRYLLAGGPEKGGVAAFVDSYEARPEDETRYESHERMADIQAVLAGDEFISVFFLRGDEKESMRDDTRDLAFYEDKPAGAARVLLTPGMFTLVMPGEAHMPCVKASGGRVKKLVVKIPAELLAVPGSR